MKYYIMFFIFTVSFLFAAIPNNSYAYIDPGTGSYFLQMLLAGLLGALFAVKIFWHKIKDFFSNLFKKSKEDDDKKN